ncbi:MAG: HD domain-containing protein, partial [Butyricicoccaceae bacterium]
RALRSCRALLERVSSERITAELLRILCGAYAGRVLMEYPEIFVQIMPELAPMVGFDQRNFHHRYDVWEHSVRALEGIRPEPELRLAMLLHDCGKPAVFSVDENGTGHFYGHPKASREIAVQVLSHLRLDNRMYDEVLYLVRHHDEPLGVNEKSVRRKLSVHGEERYRKLLAVKKADCIGQGTSAENVRDLLQIEQLFAQVLEQDSCLKIRDLAVGGHDLMEWGLRGPEIGHCLSELLEQVLDDPSRNTPEQLRAIYESRPHDRIEMTVSGMSWRYCAHHVRGLLNGLDGVLCTEVDLPSGRVTVSGRELDRERIHSTLTDAGYEVIFG